jgi:hypothetical protein
MSYTDFWGLPMIPFILVITLQDRKTLFYVFLAFRDLNKVKRARILVMSIFRQEATRALTPHEKGQEAQWSPCGVGVPPSCSLPVNQVVASNWRTRPVVRLLVTCLPHTRLIIDTTGEVLVVGSRPRLIVELHTRAVGYSVLVEAYFRAFHAHKFCTLFWLI